MTGRILIYGAYGYTGELVARQAVARGLAPVLAGRNLARTRALAEELGLEGRGVDLAEPATLRAALEDCDLVLHCAGPFRFTSKPMADACLETATHYLDITGEIPVFEALAARSREAEARAVLLMPGVGFDVVPTDCLAAHLARRLPDATHLAMGFASLGGPSRGTAATVIESLGQGSAIRRDGRIVTEPQGRRTRRIDFGKGERLAMSIAWGDVSTAYRTTGIPNVEFFTSVSPKALRAARLSGWLAPLLASRWLKDRLLARLEKRPSGPSREQRSNTVSRLWGEATNNRGEVATARMTTPNGYTLTAEAAIACAERVLATGGEGYWTPAGLFGPDFVLSLSGVERHDVG